MHLIVIAELDRYILLAPNLDIFCISILVGRYITEISERR